MTTWKRKQLPKSALLQLWLLPLAYALPWLMASTLFFIPLSSTLKSITVPLALLSILVIPSKRTLIVSLLRRPWAILALSFVLLVILACYWSPASWHNQWDIISKYIKLLFIPILAAGFSSQKSRMLAQQAFIAAMLLTALCSFYYAYVLHSPLLHDIAGSVFRNHIMTSIMMALACFISLNLAFESRAQRRCMYLIISVLLSWQLFFINQGRVGYLAYLVMLGIFFLGKCSLKQLLSAVLIMITLGIGTYHFSAILQLRIQESVSDIKTFHEGNTDTSLGYRYLFHKYAYRKFKQQFIVGYGTGSFTYLYAKDKPVASWDRKLLEPHSQYWLIAVEQGLLGIVLLLLFYTALLWESRKMNDTRIVFRMLFVAFLLGSFTDSLLLYSGTGYLFITMSALCLGETLPFSQSKKITT